LDTYWTNLGDQLIGTIITQTNATSAISATFELQPENFQTSFVQNTPSIFLGSITMQPSLLPKLFLRINTGAYAEDLVFSVYKHRCNSYLTNTGSSLFNPSILPSLGNLFVTWNDSLNNVRICNNGNYFYYQIISGSPTTISIDINYYSPSNVLPSLYFYNVASSGTKSLLASSTTASLTFALTTTNFPPNTRLLLAIVPGVDPNTLVQSLDININAVGASSVQCVYVDAKSFKFGGAIKVSSIIPFSSAAIKSTFGFLIFAIFVLLIENK